MNKEQQRVAEWNKLCSFVASEMRQHVLPYTTPISHALSNTYGEHHGSASYIEYDNQKFILTNDHVSNGNTGCQLTHMFWDLDSIFSVNKKWFSIYFPVDVSACLVNNSTWKHDEHKAEAIPLHRFAKKHAPIERELLFFTGYSGDRSKFYFGHLFSAGTPYLTQETPIPTSTTEADEEYHFALPYKPDQAISVDGAGALPRPPGFSGSLVWDTKSVMCLKRGEHWSPSMAEVTGLVWGWPSSKACIIATKVEHLRISHLLEVTRQYA